MEFKEFTEYLQMSQNPVLTSAIIGAGTISHIISEGEVRISNGAQIWVFLNVSNIDVNISQEYFLHPMARQLGQSHLIHYGAPEIKMELQGDLASQMMVHTVMDSMRSFQLQTVYNHTLITADCVLRSAEYYPDEIISLCMDVNRFGYSGL